MRRHAAGVLAAVPLLAGAATGRADPIDDYIGEQMQLRQIPGLSLAVVRNGKLVKAKGYGLANLETKTPATPNTVYQLASVTKQFTATAILLLAQDGKLALDDKINRHLEHAPAAWQDVTIRHLLTHTSGIKDYDNDPDIYRLDTTPEKIIARVADAPLDFAPGAKWSYSNTGYVLLGMIVHGASGKAYDRLLEERVFRPLGMKATRRSSLDDVIPNRAAGYVVEGGKVKNSTYLNPTLWDNGDGGILSTVLDLAKWNAALDGDGILSAASRKQMWTAARLADGKDCDYGLAWNLRTQHGHRIAFHAGGRPGTSTDVTRLLDDGLSVVVLANDSSVPTSLFSLHVAVHYVPDLLPARPRVVEVPAARLAEYAGRYRNSPDEIFTLREAKGALLKGPGLERFLPASESTFFADDFPVTITFRRDGRGAVVGLTAKTEQGERQVPRIGPLVHALRPEPDADPTLTRRIVAAVQALAQGGRPVEESRDISAGAKLARKGLGPGPLPQWTGIESLAFVAEEDVADRAIERRGSKVARIRYYKLLTDGAPRYALVHLTAEGLVTDVNLVED